MDNNKDMPERIWVDAKYKRMNKDTDYLCHCNERDAAIMGDIEYIRADLIHTTKEEGTHE